METWSEDRNKGTNQSHKMLMTRILMSSSQEQWTLTKALQFLFLSDLNVTFILDLLCFAKLTDSGEGNFNHRLYPDVPTVNISLSNAHMSMSFCSHLFQRTFQNTRSKWVGSVAARDSSSDGSTLHDSLMPENLNTIYGIPIWLDKILIQETV